MKLGVVAKTVEDHLEIRRAEGDGAELPVLVSETLDLFGRSFVLLRLGYRAPDEAGLESAARAFGMPLETVTVTEPAVAAAYEAALVLVRPDGHVAWRSDTAPEDADAIIDTVRGARMVTEEAA